ncbi:hypothetical protein MAUB1S_01521 [Mycolicibacterium aubagnense]
MAIRGRKPKAVGLTRHRNPPAHAWTEVLNVPFEGAPKLPARRCNGRPWPTRTRKAWKAWSTMPHCVLWQPSDWSFALDTLELTALVHEGEPRWAAEVRNRQRVLGTTAEFLRDMRIRYVGPEEPGTAAGATVTSMQEWCDL